MPKEIEVTPEMIEARLEALAGSVGGLKRSPARLEAFGTGGGDRPDAESGRNLRTPTSRVFPLIRKYSVLVLSFIGIGFLVLDHFGVWDHLRGIDQLQQFAARLDTSYGTVPLQLRPEDAGWNAVISLIHDYSSAQLPPQRKPKAFARFPALSSSFAGSEQNPIARTAPATPIALIYVESPTADGRDIDPSDYRIVGTIGDLHDWIRRKQENFKFWVYDIFLGAILAVAALLAV